MIFSFKKRKLRVDILTIFASLFLFTITSIVYYFYSQSSKAVIQISHQLIEQTNQSIAENLDHFLRPEPFVKISNYLLSNGILDMSDMRSLAAFMQVILASYPQLMNAYLADDKGNMFIENIVEKNPLTTRLIPFVLNQDIPPDTCFISGILTYSKPTTLLTLNYNNKENVIIKSVKESSIQYDPRTRPWFIGAKNATSSPWIGEYQFYGSKKSGITIAFPLYVKNKFVGVAAADVKLNLIKQELKRFSLSKKGIVFIVNHHGQIITDKNNEGVELPTVYNIDNSIITTAYNLYKNTRMDKLNFYYNNVRYIANFKPYGLSKTEHWEIATILPENIFISGLKEANKKILVFSLLLLLFGLILIYILAHKISKPIMHLATETKNIIKLKFDKPTQIKTHIYEVQVMIDAMNAMKSTLSSFAKYVPKMLVEQLLQNKLIAQLGGKKQNITILFTDVENFTSISEHADPELLMIHFSEYLNVVTQCIQQHQGNIDKYIGDAVMAFWGVPFIDERHILHACEAILDCQQQLREKNRAWLMAGKPVYHTRFGLNTGIAVVGNMGSNDRLNYTAIGDTVNLAARLETLNKVYGTEIIVSDSVYEICGSQFLFRPLDQVRVKGKQQITEIYELISGKPGSDCFSPTDEQIEKSDLTWQGYRSYHQQEFNKAKSTFITLLEKFPEDQIAQMYIARCEKYL